MLLGCNYCVHGLPMCQPISDTLSIIYSQSRSSSCRGKGVGSSRSAAVGIKPQEHECHSTFTPILSGHTSNPMEVR